MTSPNFYPTPDFIISVPFIIDIKSKHICEGERNSCHRCPTSLAILDLIPCLVDQDVDVTEERIIIHDREESREYRDWKISTPAELSDWIVEFDNSDELPSPCKPIQVEITQDMIEEIY